MAISTYMKRTPPVHFRTTASPLARNATLVRTPYFFFKPSPDRLLS